MPHVHRKEIFCKERKNEPVEYVAPERDQIVGQRPKIVMFEGGNGDLYMTMCWESEKMGSPVMRIEKSGGCATRSPKVFKALCRLYEAIMEEEQKG